jgi:hypothetical protein
MRGAEALRYEGMEGHGFVGQVTLGIISVQGRLKEIRQVRIARRGVKLSKFGGFMLAAAAWARMARCLR